MKLSCDGFDLTMDFDVSDPIDCEILLAAFLLMIRRGKKDD